LLHSCAPALASFAMTEVAGVGTASHSLTGRRFVRDGSSAATARIEPCCRGTGVQHHRSNGGVIVRIRAGDAREAQWRPAGHGAVTAGTSITLRAAERRYPGGCPPVTAGPPTFDRGKAWALPWEWPIAITGVGSPYRLVSQGHPAGCPVVIRRQPAGTSTGTNPFHHWPK
jgi:hypothetical protein